MGEEVQQEVYARILAAQVLAVEGVREVLLQLSQLLPSDLVLPDLQKAYGLSFQLMDSLRSIGKNLKG